MLKQIKRFRNLYKLAREEPELVDALVEADEKPTVKAFKPLRDEDRATVMLPMTEEEIAAYMREEDGWGKFLGVLRNRDKRSS